MCVVTSRLASLRKVHIDGKSAVLLKLTKHSTKEIYVCGIVATGFFYRKSVALFYRSTRDLIPLIFQKVIHQNNTE